ncbi:MAG: hypothetical protein IKQ55_05545 [Kiritimatiellae bacterium]|nr:hypothetical protein [Kiritimatiellia bacterium]
MTPHVHPSAAPAIFPTIGKLFSNHWKNRGKFFQSLEKTSPFFQPLEKKFPIVGKLFPPCLGARRARLEALP